MLAHIFNMASGRKQCAMRDDGVWFVRHRRHNGPGFTHWSIAPFQTRPPYAWYSGDKARLPNDSRNDRPTYPTTTD